MAARLLIIMGSGETTPTMAKIHRRAFDAAGPEGAAVSAVLLGTPYGFQTNAADISTRTVGYFRQSVGRELAVAPLYRPRTASAHDNEAALARVAAAGLVFSGPGSPTYALAQWRGTALPGLLEDKLSRGGAVVFSSAAAMTLGRWTVPVYEVYKAGGDVAWAEGLDLLGPFGLHVAVIAHFDNAEGGHHDTRYCYLGEERLCQLEAQLPEEGWVLGVDEHTAAVLDLDTRTLEVVGLGTVTGRSRGNAVTFKTGESIGIDALIGAVRGLQAGARPATGAGPRGAAGLAGELGKDGPTSDALLLAEARRLGAAFNEALAGRDIARAMEAVFDLEEALHEWAADTFESDHADKARAVLRSMLARLGALAGLGLRDPRSVVGPWVKALLVERAEARRSQRFSDSDRVRDALSALGVEVRDTPDGSQWDLYSPDAG